MRNLSNRDGFALPMAVLVIAVLSAALAAAFISTNSEIRTNQGEKGMNSAFAIAQNGLEQFLVRRTEAGWCNHCNVPAAPPSADSEWTRVSVTNGYADVISRRVHTAVNNNDKAIYFIISHGVDTTIKLPSGGGTIYAERTVGLYAYWNTLTMKVLSAWTSLSGIDKAGSAGFISGVNACNPADSVAGVTVPIGDWGQSGHFTPTGKPPYDSMRSVATLDTAVHIDWAGIMGGSLAADVEIPPGSWPTSSQFADTSYWPIIRIHTNGYGLPGPGQGTIIADSDFSISGSNMWNGIILVGGQLTSNGNNTTSGSTVSGLNVLIGGVAAAGQAQANGTKSYQYNSCNVSRATTRLQAYNIVSNSWLDNVAIY